MMFSKYIWNSENPYQELVYYYQLNQNREKITAEEEQKLKSILTCRNKKSISDTSLLQTYLNNNSKLQQNTILEWGPNLQFVTPWSSNALNILHHSGLTCIQRIEFAYRQINNNELILLPVIDNMTQKRYPEKLTSFNLRHLPNPSMEELFYIPLSDLKDYNQLLFSEKLHI